MLCKRQVFFGDCFLQSIEKKGIFMAQNKTQKKKSAWEVILNILLWIIIVAVLFVDVVGVICKLQGDDTLNFFGYRAYLVANSPSMSKIHESNMHYLADRQDEQFGANDLIFIKPVEDPSQLQIYTVVAYRNDKGKTIVHRIIDKLEYVNENGETVRMYTCRGDANNANDPYLVDERQIVGIYWATWGETPATLIRFTQSIYGIIAMAGCLFIYFFACFWIELLADKQRKEQAVWDDWNGRYQGQQAEMGYSSTQLTAWGEPRFVTNADSSVVTDKVKRTVYLGVMPAPPTLNPNGKNTITPPYQAEDPLVLMAKTPKERAQAQRYVDKRNAKLARKNKRRGKAVPQQQTSSKHITTKHPYPTLPPNAVDLYKEWYNDN